MGFVKVGAQTLASQAAARRMQNGYVAPPGAHGAYGAWSQAPVVIPGAAYNPTLDIELAAGKRGLGNTLEDLITAGSRGDAGFALNEGEVERQRGEQTAAHTHALAALALQFKRQGSRQTEQANAAGVSRGGALAQAAAKRTANEGRAREPLDLNYQNALAGDNRSLARLALAHQQEAEDHATTGARAEREQNQFGLDTRTVEAREATNNGYLDPGGVVARTSTQGKDWVRVGGAQRPWH